MKGFAVALFVLSSCVVGEVEDDDVDDNLLEAKVTAKIKVVTHNVFKQQSAIKRAMDKAEAIDAQVVALQEVCPGQKQWLEATYGDQFTIGSVPATRPALQGCPLPDGSQEIPFVVIIWRGGKNGTVTPYSELGGPALAPGNRLVCVKFEKGGVPVHACSVHLISGDWKDPVSGVEYDGETVREQQASGLKRIAATWFDGNQNHFGILAGDFNSTPDMAPLDKLYAQSLGGRGDFVEYNRNGNGRNGDKTVDTRKIDYVFFSANRAPVDGAAVDIIDTDSNHHMVVSTVQMRK
jgi:endonuclease/exonuclease/phosphatase family metal-dependent hydrolase